MLTVRCFILVYSCTRQCRGLSRLVSMDCSFIQLTPPYHSSLIDEHRFTAQTIGLESARLSERWVVSASWARQCFTCSPCPGGALFQRPSIVSHSQVIGPSVGADTPIRAQSFSVSCCEPKLSGALHGIFTCSLSFRCIPQATPVDSCFRLFRVCMVYNTRFTT